MKQVSLGLHVSQTRPITTGFKLFKKFKAQLQKQIDNERAEDEAKAKAATLRRSF